MTEAVQNSVRMVQPGCAAALFATQLLNFKGPPYHNALQRANNSSHQSKPHSWKVRVRRPVLCYVTRGFELRSEIITALCYYLFLYLPYITEHWSNFLICSVCAHIYVSFSKTGVCFWSWNPHFRWKYSSNAVSVQLCEQRNVAVAVHLHFHPVRNLSVYTVCNSSVCWCAGRIGLSRTAHDARCEAIFSSSPYLLP